MLMPELYFEKSSDISMSDNKAIKTNTKGPFSQQNHSNNNSSTPNLAS